MIYEFDDADTAPSGEDRTQTAAAQLWLAADEEWRDARAARKKPVAVVTGARRGIGAHLVRAPPVLGSYLARVLRVTTKPDIVSYQRVPFSRFTNAHLVLVV